MKRRRRLILRSGAVLLLLSAYPVFVLGYTWSHVAGSDLPGGRLGPLDAYRHTLASAVVAFTLSPRAVDWVTSVMERGGNASNRMDRHNNRIGAVIGSRARSFGEIERAVSAQVQRGAAGATDSAQVTWLPPNRWRSGSLW